MELRTMQRLLKESLPAADQSCRINLITNITLEPYLTPFLKMHFANSSILAEVETISSDVLSAGLPESDLTVVLLHFETQYPDWYNEIAAGKISPSEFQAQLLEHCRRIYNTVKASASGNVLWFGYEQDACPVLRVCGAIFPLHGMMEEIDRELRAMMQEGDVFVDTRHLLASVGLSAAYDAKNKYRWNAPYSQTMIRALADEIHKQYRIHHGVTKKCLVLDCDGVLWGGILSEDGIEGIKLGGEGLGRPYQDFQRFLLSLYYHGVILAICSKNDLQDVLQVFRNHSGMILQEEQIACFQVNGENKPENIRKIAETLRLGLSSMVFVDDSSFEVESVRSLLPEVTSVLYDSKTVYEQLSCFNLRTEVDLDQITKRNETYQSNRQRNELYKESLDFESYLRSLQMKIDIHPAFPSEYARIAELTQRTNQCTNGVRYTVADIKTRLAAPAYRLFAVSVSDRFSDLGVVGAIGIENSTLDLFSLSCRALGRNVETEMLETAMRYGVKEFRFATTHKNTLLKEILQKKFA